MKEREKAQKAATIIFEVLFELFFGGDKRCNEVGSWREERGTWGCTSRALGLG